MLKTLVCLAATAASALGAHVVHSWDIEWVTASPDAFARPVVGINGQWPLPVVEAFVGDTLQITIHNKLGNESTGIHWHGIHQIGSNEQDGPAHVTQCPVAPGQSFTYEFVLDKSGTYWYHSHTGTQYPDGLRGALIIKDHIDPYVAAYDEEYLLTLSDWYHGEVPSLLTAMFTTANAAQLRPPVPQSGLINEESNLVANNTFKFEAGKKYKFRVINMSALASVLLFLEDHDFIIIETDGQYTKPATASFLHITPAQRYSIIVQAKTDATRNYALQAVFDINPDFRNPRVGFPINTTAGLEYDASLPFPSQFIVPSFNVFDDFTLSPLDELPITGAADNTITLDFSLGADAAGLPSAFVNNVSYVHQKVPTLYTVLSAGGEAENPDIYGAVNPYFVKKGEVVDIILNNRHTAHHPFHFHGHHFHVCERTATGSGVFTGEVDCSNSPLVRDVVAVNALASVVIRFKADNPGVWLIHCHIEWHVPMGLSATIIEDAFEIQKTIDVPEEHFEICKAGCYPTKGNAAGSLDLTDLSGITNVENDNVGALFTFEACPAEPSSSVSSAVPSSTISTGPSGTGSTSPSGTGSTGPSGTGSTGPSGTGSTGPSGTGSTGPSGTGSTGPSGTGSTGPSGTGSTGPSGTGSTGPSGTGSTGPSSSVPTVGPSGIWSSGSGVPTVGPSGTWSSGSGVPTAGPSDTWSSDTEWTTSTVYTTTQYTVTACPPTVTNCPGKPYVTTEIIPWTTTVCPVTEHWPEWTTSTLYTTTEYPITGPSGPYVTTEIVPWTTTVCPVTEVWPVWTASTLYSTTTYTITSCAATVTNCPGSPEKPWVTSEAVPWSTTVYTVAPVTTAGWAAPGGWAAPTGLVTTSYGTAAPSATSTSKNFPVTAGAGKAASGFGAAALAAVLAVVALL
ncbi:Cupredoxin [Lasiosphaeris hirsuta]|uniref:Cupredoxin n=1 Tax=Lasiosphaeris hirsuta TaxID=260670 RepID=A0AA39ZRH9_9PEZI|nr:Cupredoxin [Lasiosphaeris hirsuta]